MIIVSKRLYLVSLVIFATNEKDVVAGSETMARFVDLEGNSLPPEYGHKKITLLNPKAAIAVTGTFKPEVLQFIKDFQFSIKSASPSDIDQIMQLLIGQATATLTLDPAEDYRFILDGFKDTQPSIKALHMYPDKPAQTEIPQGHYFASGEGGGLQLAGKLLAEAGIDSRTRTKDLKQIVKSVIEQCVREYPDDLGGMPDVRVLHRY
jgi:hypothetical protein